MEHDGPDLTWRLPATWTERNGGGEGGLRYKSVTIPAKGQPLDLSVSMLDRRGGRICPTSIAGEIKSSQLYFGKRTAARDQQISMAGVDATLIEMKGFKIPVPVEREPFEYTLPDVGEIQKTPFSLLSFRSEDGLKFATISVSEVGGTLEGT